MYETLEALSRESRNRIMARLKQTLAVVPPPLALELPDIVKPDPAWGGKDDPLSLLRVSMMRMKGDLTELEGADAIPWHVSKILEAEGAPMEVAIGSDEGLRSLPWDEAGLSVIGPSGIASESAGVSRALCAVAETGSVVFCSGSANPTTVNFMVKYHFAVIRREQIVPNFEDLWGIIRPRYMEGDRMRAVNIISGPSATADVEATLTVGAHGPCRFELLLIEGQF